MFLRSVTNHIDILSQGVEVWNEWRRANPDVVPDLSGANLSRLTNTKLAGANFSGSRLVRTDFDYSYLKGCDLREANLSEALCHNTTLIEANLTSAILVGAKMSRANLCSADCSNADFTDAFLGGASFVRTNVSGATFIRCEVFGLSAWGLIGKPLRQEELLVTPPYEAEIRTDRLEVAQLLYTMLSNRKISDIVEAVAAGSVLILGRFQPERFAVLERCASALRSRGWIPIIFNFDKPGCRTTQETIEMLASLVRYVIADVTDCKSVLQELRGIVPDSPSITVQPVIQDGQNEPGMWDFFKPYPWVRKTIVYRNANELVRRLNSGLLKRAPQRRSKPQNSRRSDSKTVGARNKGG